VSQKQLNLGILAHVDAGKTTLTERLLFEAGVIDEVGSVDAGTTQTDSLELERRRGITIKSAVASFPLGGVHVNLIDTPGHPDFIAEVERVLNVLDGAVLVISAVEGVQPQTRILMRALQRLRIPTLLFVNKIDRAGADDERTIHAISERLTPAVVRMGSANALGTRAAGFEPFGSEDVAFRATLAEALAEHSDRILASYVEDEGETPYPQLVAELASQTKQVLVHPVYFGSALTGAGVESLAAGIPELLPAASGDAAGPPAGLVFKIERDPKGQKIAYVRMFSGTIRTRDQLSFDAHEAKVTAVAVFEHGPAVQRPTVSAGEVAKLWGLGDVQIGDRLGESSSAAEDHQFPPPTLESVVSARNPDDRAALRVALAQLAEQDPLIDVRQNDVLDELSVSLYGEVQQEVIQATLSDEYGIEVEFLEATPIHVERPVRTGEAAEVLHAETNPFRATIGLRVEPGPVGSGIEFRLDVDAQSAPLYVYKTLASFAEHMAQYVRSTLHEGLSGWQVTDCLITMNRCMYSVPDGPPSRRGPLSTAADFRKLTPLVLMRALHSAGTSVCEPVVRGELEIPAASIGAVTAALGRLGASLETQSLRGDLAMIETVLSAARAQELQRELSRLTGGEGVLEASFVGYEPVSGKRPIRKRTTANALNRDEYLEGLARHSQSG
jgi:ribosomal protection tetracycline resistance protein